MTTLVLIFSVTLMAAVLLSGLAHRSVLSTAVLFLAAGFLVGPGGLGWLDITMTDPIVLTLAELTLFAVLFTDGTQATIGKIRRAWKLPGRALLLGLPATVVIGGLIVKLLTDLTWVDALMVGAVLSPTDPVFAAAIVGATQVPKRLRHLLHVESGLNDGLALAVVLVLLAISTGGHLSPTHMIYELAAGTALGIAIPWVLLKLEASRWFEAHGRYQPLNAFGIGLLVLAACELTHANPYLAAFAAGVTVGSTSPQVAHSYHAFGEGIAELLKLAAILVFGALLSVPLFTGLGISGWVAVALLIVAARPLALAAALAGSELTKREWAAAAWFGPKGFASVVYGLLILTSGAAAGETMFNLVAACVAVSIVAHSSTDILVGRWFKDPIPEPDEDAAPTADEGSLPATTADLQDVDELLAWDSATADQMFHDMEPQAAAASDRAHGLPVTVGIPATLASDAWAWPGPSRTRPADPAGTAPDSPASAASEVDRLKDLVATLHPHTTPDAQERLTATQRALLQDVVDPTRSTSATSGRAGDGWRPEPRRWRD